MPLVQGHHVVQAFAADAANEPFHVGILPWALGGDEDLFDPHVPHPLPKIRLGVGYEVRATAGAIPSWVPTQVWDTGDHTVIRFPTTLTSSEAPALFVQTPEGTRQLVNYRQVGAYYVADRLAEVWELKLGPQAQSQVEIWRTAAYRSVTCPGDPACPVGPTVGLAAAPQ